MTSLPPGPMVLKVLEDLSRAQFPLACYFETTQWKMAPAGSFRFAAMMQTQLPTGRMREAALSRSARSSIVPARSTFLPKTLAGSHAKLYDYIP
jgi:hypothetical protein